MRAFIVSQMFGDWAVVYNRVPVDNVMKEVTMTQVNKNRTKNVGFK